MSNNELDLQARKQLLLTRIALERVQWTHDVAVVRTAASPRHMMAAVVRSALPPGWGDALFDSSGRSRSSTAASIGHQAMKAVLIARRYPILMSLGGALLARRMIRRILVIGSFGAAVAAGVWLSKSSRAGR